MSATFRASRENGAMFRLVLVPALISLVITMWRLTGELLAWSESWFNPEAGGLWSIVGIAWLTPVFGVYFALKLSSSGQLPTGWAKALGLSLAGFIVLFGATPLQVSIYQKNIYLSLVYVWIVAVVAAAIQYRAWPALTRTLLAYGLAARIPVILIMFLAMWGQWGTHYDAAPAGFPETVWFTKFLLLGFLPQILFWVSFTVVTGAFFGILVGGWVSRKKPGPA